MPITQHRMTRLLSVTKAYKDALTSCHHAADAAEAHKGIPDEALYGLLALIRRAVVKEEALAVYIREVEHFNAFGKYNERKRIQMQRRRSGEKNLEDEIPGFVHFMPLAPTLPLDELMGQEFQSPEEEEAAAMALMSPEHRKAYLEYKAGEAHNPANQPVPDLSSFKPG